MAISYESCQKGHPPPKNEGNCKQKAEKQLSLARPCSTCHPHGLLDRLAWQGLDPAGSTGEQWPIPMYLRAYTTKQTPKSAKYCANNAYSVHGVNPHGLLNLGTVSIEAKRISGPQKHANGK